MTTPTPWLSRISPCPSVVGEQWARAGWIEPLRIIYDHELVLFRGGAFVVEIDGRKLACPGDSFVIVPPGREHTSRAVSRGGRRYWAHFDWTYQGPRGETPIMTYLPGRGVQAKYRPAPAFVPKGVLHGPIRSSATTFDLHRRLWHLWSRGDQHSGLLARARLLELLVELLDTGEVSGAPRQPEEELSHRVRTALDGIAHRSVAEMPSIQDHLAQLGYSYAHLCRRFHEAYGLSPLQYVNALRIERARLLLRDASLPISEIARRVGHDNPAYFCRQFRKYTGQSPLDYARGCRLTATGDVQRRSIHHD
jgi:AraC-like DNA-binding protein